ncbi:hypothetical protein [Demequina mangrovi]|uniref:Uncharacterized protein n=1 Tax=Demequina mangrovi TaxID=1043493 RepID=A0A1H6TV85_9MICO|nr:hypothetical protein [Demequina mangrovi]SEI82124.1 hypothetical protein SAMN05421637_0102 [Demequina mangrovi]
MSIETGQKSTATVRDSASLWSGTGLAVIIALCVTVSAFAIDGAREVPAGAALPANPIAEQRPAPAGELLGRALDANVAEVESFLDWGGRADYDGAGRLVLDAHGITGRMLETVLAADLARSMAVDPDLVAEAIAAAERDAVPENGIARGTASSDLITVICTESHDGMTLAFEDRSV